MIKVSLFLSRNVKRIEITKKIDILSDLMFECSITCNEIIKVNDEKLINQYNF